MKEEGLPFFREEELKTKDYLYLRLTNKHF